MADVLIHIGKGEDRKTYRFDENKLMNVEAMAMERVTGRGLTEILAGVQEGSLIALTAIIWVLRRREEPGLQFEDVQFRIMDLDTGDDEEPEETVPKEAGPEDPAEPN